MYINKLKKKILLSDKNDIEKTEILELLLYFIGSTNVEKNKKLSLELLSRYNSLYDLIKCEDYKYMRSKIVTEDLYIFFKIIDNIIESNILYEQIKNNKYSVQNAKSIYKYLQYKISFSEREIFYVIYLNTQNEIIHQEELFKGTLDFSTVYVREIIKKVIYYNAKSVILSHNHPSGSLKPSNSDKEITKYIINALEYLDVAVLDHLILSKKGYYSFMEGGIL